MPHWFDDFTKELATDTLSRREVVQLMAAAALATLGGPLITRTAASARPLPSNGLALAGATSVNGMAPIEFTSGQAVVTKSAIDTYSGQVTTMSATVMRTVLHGNHAGPHFDQKTKRIVPVPTKASLGGTYTVTTGKETVLTVRTHQPHPGVMKVNIQYGVGFSGGKHLVLEVNDGKGTGSFDGRALRPFTKSDTKLYFSDGQPVPPRTMTPATKIAINRVLAKFKASGGAAAVEPVQVAYMPTVVADGSNNPPPVDTSDCTGCQSVCGIEYAGCAGSVAIGCAASCGVGCLVDVVLEATGNGCSNAVENCVNNCNKPGGACCQGACYQGSMCCTGNGAHCCTFGKGSTGTQICCGANQACCYGGCCPAGQLCPNVVTYICCNPGQSLVCGSTCCATGMHCGNYEYSLCCPKNTNFCKAYPGARPHSGLCCAPGTTCCNNFNMAGTYGSGGGMVCCPNDDYVCVGSYGFRGPCVKKSEMCGDQYCPGRCKNGKCCLESGSGATAARWCGDTCCQGECCKHNKDLCCGLCLSGVRTTLGTCCDTGVACGKKCCPSGCADARTSTCKPSKCASHEYTCISSMAHSNATETVCCPKGINCCNGKCCPIGQVCCQNKSNYVLGCHAQADCYVPPPPK